MFNWPDFFDRYGIEYTERGPNIARGDVGIRCPFCGAADTSQHMAVSLEGRGWICRRDRTHSGRSPIRLIRALSGCSLEQARAMVGAPALPGAATVLSEVEALLGPVVETSPALTPPLREPPEFKKFGPLPSARPFVGYMGGRGFTYPFLQRASDTLGLRYVSRGSFGGRVIFLVMQDKRLVGWTGRSLWARATVRYMTLPARADAAERLGMPPALMPIEHCLLWSDECMAGGDTFYLVEGPMDALKLRSLGEQAACQFTSFPSRQQIDLLRGIAPRFRRRVVLLDKGAEAFAARAASELRALDFALGQLPLGIKDPGELTRDVLTRVQYY